MAAIVSFIGWHDSGKTTLATNVVFQLKKLGYSVAVMKSSSEEGLEFDTPGTDTYKHKTMGADDVLLLAPDQMVLQSFTPQHSLQTIAHRYFPDADIVIAEGFKKARKIAKIEVVRDEDQCIRKDVTGVVAVATNLENLSYDCVFRLDEAVEIAAFIEKRYIDEGKEELISLLVNGNSVPMKSFIQRSLAGTVHGYVNSLKVTDNIKEIELRIKLRS
ncbi:MAG: molybdopterin-guanine dinucleotide biosynthesis protein B [Desulfotalea sp.]